MKNIEQRKRYFQELSLCQLLIGKYDFKTSNILTYIDTMSTGKLNGELKKDEFTIVQNYMIWECNHILRPKFCNMLYSAGDYNIKDILFFTDNLNLKDCYYYKYSSLDILKRDFERWKRRRSK